jgi:hypothetical protein
VAAIDQRGRELEEVEYPAHDCSADRAKYRAYTPTLITTPVWCPFG